jgi:hypothetical protein
MQRVAACCRVSQRVAVWCSVLQCVAVWCSVRCCVHCSVVQCVAVLCSVVWHVAVCCSVLQCVAVCCSVLPWVAVCCSLLSGNSMVLSSSLLNAGKCELQCSDESCPQGFQKPNRLSKAWRCDSECGCVACLWVVKRGVLLLQR